MATVLRGGHMGSVLCCEVLKNDEGKLLTGGECGEICMWSYDGDKIGKVTIDTGDDDVTSIYTMKSRPDLFYCSYMQKILLYDVRQFQEPVEQFTFNEEEINQITMNDKEEYLASCDDSGTVKIVSLMHKNVFKTLRKHTNICASVAFRPKRPWDLFSAGYDQRLIQWDFSRAKAVCNIDIQEVGVTPDKFDSYVVNPPFIHSIAVSNSGAYLACGTESALVQVFNSSKRTLSFMATLRGHSQGVSQVHFPNFEENILVSGGNDGVCNIWKLDDLGSSGPQTNGYHHHNGTTAHHNGGTSPRDTNSAATASATTTTAASDTASVNTSSDTHSTVGGEQEQENPDPEPTMSPRPCYGIHHAEKINWITSGSTANRRFIIVADSTSEPTVYNYPD